VDDLERAMKNCPTEIASTEWAQGIELIYRKLLSLLEAEGVTKIEAEGQPFDPNLHEAISHEEVEGYQEGQIIEVVKQGYRVGERVLRPALVRVAR
jgi:molecular chaperone GrpE